jgi:hypothetical protein
MARQSSRPESGRHGTTGASFDETARSFSDRLLGLLSRKNPLWPPGQATHPELLRLWGRMYDATEDLRRQSSLDRLPGHAQERLVELMQKEPDALDVLSAWELADQLKLELLLAGEVSYVSNQLAREASIDRQGQDEDPWGRYFPASELAELQRALRKADVSAAVLDEAIARVKFLYQRRSEHGRLRHFRVACPAST